MLRLSTSFLRMNFVSRGFAYQPDQSFQSGNEISRTTSPSETLEAMSESMNPQTLAYGLRIFGRNLRNEHKSLSLLERPEFIGVKKRVLEHLPNSKAQELCDILGFERIIKSFKKNAFTIEEKNQISKRVQDLLETQEFTSRQLFNLFNDISNSSLKIISVERAVIDILSDQSQLLTLTELKLALQSLNSDLHYSYIKGIRNVLFRLKSIDYESAQNYEIIDILGNLSKHAKSVKFTNSCITQISFVIIERLNSFNEADIIKLAYFFNDSELTTDYLYHKLLESIKEKLKENPYEFSEKFYNFISGALIKQRKIGRSVPDSILEVFSEAILKKFEADQPNCFLFVKTLELLTQFKSNVEPRFINQFIEKLRTLSDSYQSIALFKLVSLLPNLNSFSTEGLITEEDINTKFDELYISNKIHALALVSNSSLSPQWQDLMDSLETKVAEMIENIKPVEMFASFNKLFNNDEVDSINYKKLNKMKAAFFNVINKNSDDEKYCNAKTILYIAPWDEEAAYLLLEKIDFNQNNFRRILNEFPKSYPCDVLISLCEKFPSITNFQNLMLVAARIETSKSFHKQQKLTSMITEADDFLLHRNAACMRLSKYLITIHEKVSQGNFNALAERCSDALLAHDVENIGEVYLYLAQTLKSFGKLSLDVAQQIVENKFKSNSFNRNEILEFASIVFTRLDHEKVRQKLIHPVMKQNPSDLILMSLPSILIWPHNEGEIENEYIGKVKNAISRIKRLQDGKFSELIGKLIKGRSEAHSELYNTVFNSLNDALPSMQGLSNPGALLEFAEAYSQSSLKSKRFDEAILSSYSSISHKTQSFVDAGIHTAIYKKDIRSAALSETIAKKFIKNFKFFRNFTPNFLFELADLDFAKESWAQEAFKSAEEHAASYIKKDNDLTRYLFAFISSGASDDQLKPFASRLNTENYQSFIKLLVRDYLNRRNLTGDTVTEAVSYEHLNLCQRNFGISMQAAAETSSCFEHVNEEVKLFETVEGLEIPIYLPAKQIAIWPLTSRSYFDDRQTIRKTHQFYMELATARGLNVVSVSNLKLKDKEPEEKIQILKDNGLVL